MSFARNPLQTLLLATALAAGGFAATAQTTTPPPPPAAGQKAGPGGPHGGWDHHDPAKRAERVAKHLAELKAKLKITPAQEGGWSTFAASMQPPAKAMERPDHAAFAKLTTPERIDKMRALRDARNTRMDQRAAATKTFYGTLTADQKKTFDETTLHHFGRGHGDHDGKPGGPPPRG